MRRRDLLTGAGAALLGTAPLSACTARPVRRGPPALVAEVTRLLAARGRALAAGDVEAAAAGCAPASAGARAELRRADTAAVRAGLTSWSVDVEGVDEGVEGGGDRDARVRGRLRVRVVGEGREVAGPWSTALVRRDGAWALALPDAAGAPHPWDLGDVRAHRVPGGVVLLVRPGHDVDAAADEAAGRVAAEAAEDLPAATARVDAAWGPDWPRGTAVVVVPTTALAARLAGLDPRRAAALDAVAVGQDAALPDGAPAGVRVVLAADRFARLTRAGRTATLTHELVHVATRATAGARPAADGLRPVPRWLSEGCADHLARLGLDVPAAALAAPLLRAVAAGAAPAVPADEDFEATGARLQVAYAAAWTLVTSAARRAGTPAVTALQRRLGTAPGRGGEPAAPLAERLDGACRATLGTGWADVQRTWRADVAGGLVGWGP